MKTKGPDSVIRWILAAIDDNDIPKSLGVRPGNMGTGETVAVFAFHQDKVGFTAELIFGATGATGGRVKFLSVG